LLTYPAVFEFLSKQDIPNKPKYSLREVPTDIIVSIVFIVKEKEILL